MGEIASGYISIVSPSCTSSTDSIAISLPAALKVGPSIVLIQAYSACQRRVGCRASFISTTVTLRRSISNFLTLVWRNGALEGTKVEEAYFVKCDRTTMTQTDIDSGRLICIVGVAPVKPAEFVIVRIGLWTAHADE